MPDNRPNNPENAPLREARMAADDPFSLLLHQVEEHEAATRRAAQQRATHYIPQTKAPNPSALVLVTTVYTCECGRCYRSPNPHVLVRYDEKGYQNSVHYSRTSVSPYFSLKREHKVIERTVPWCEACFSLDTASAQESISSPISAVSTEAQASGREAPVGKYVAPTASTPATRFAGQRSLAK